nr:DUF1194 domain-containing protein [Nitratireductor basaltis]
MGFLALSVPANSQSVVDVELVLAVDVSLSMSPDELEIQRRGYAEALVHDDVLNAILGGLHGRIAIAYFEWAGMGTQRLVLPWTVIASHGDARKVAETLSVDPPASARRTSISGALDFALTLFQETSFSGLRRVVDISGDGPNNQGLPVDEARDALTSRGITINGLPLMTNGGLTTRFDVRDLDTYYQDCVIGGPGAFVLPVNDWDQFAEAVRRKLVIELAGTAGAEDAVNVVKVQSSSYDCLIGEKMWDDRSWRWPAP